MFLRLLLVSTMILLFTSCGISISPKKQEGKKITILSGKSLNAKATNTKILEIFKTVNRSYTKSLTEELLSKGAIAKAEFYLGNRKDIYNYMAKNFVKERPYSSIVIRIEYSKDKNNPLHLITEYYDLIYSKNRQGKEHIKFDKKWIKTFSLINAQTKQFTTLPVSEMAHIAVKEFHQLKLLYK